jgi:hypothetical protein
VDAGGLGDVAGDAADLLDHALGRAFVADAWDARVSAHRRRAQCGTGCDGMLPWKHSFDMLILDKALAGTRRRVWDTDEIERLAVRIGLA